MLDEYRGILAIGDQMMKFTEAETIIVLLLTFKEQNKLRYNLGLEEIPKSKAKKLQDEYLDTDEMQKTISKVLGYNVSMSFTIATMSRVNMKLRVLGMEIKKKPRVGYYIKRR